MIQEMLVLLACTSNPSVHHGNSMEYSYTAGSACGSTSSLYFSENPDVKIRLDKDEKMVREYIGPSIVDTVGPALFIVGGGTGTIKINKFFSVQLSKNSGILTFRIDSF